MRRKITVLLVTTLLALLAIPAAHSYNLDPGGAGSSCEGWPLGYVIYYPQRAVCSIAYYDPYRPWLGGWKYWQPF